MSEELVIKCVHCKYDFTHQVGVFIWERGQDEPDPLHVQVANGTALITREGAGNPSLRRQGLIVRMLCEKCSQYTDLSVYQHKGRTYMEVR